MLTSGSGILLLSHVSVAAMNKGFDKSKTARSSSTLGNKLLQFKCMTNSLLPCLVLSPAKKLTRDIFLSRSELSDALMFLGVQIGPGLVSMSFASSINIKGREDLCIIVIPLSNQ